RREYARCRRGDARGLVVSPGCLLQDQLVQRQIRHRTAKPIVLRLEILQPPDLVALQAAELLPPPVVGHLAHPDRADRFRYALTLRGQNINLPQLGDDLFRLVAPPWHSGPPCEQNHSSGWTTSAGVDQSERDKSTSTLPEISTLPYRKSGAATSIRRCSLAAISKSSFSAICRRRR